MLAALPRPFTTIYKSPGRFDPSGATLSTAGQEYLRVTNGQVMAAWIESTRASASPSIRVDSGILGRTATASQCAESERPLAFSFVHQLAARAPLRARGEMGVDELHRPGALADGGGATFG
jgi:hypothetical protein